MRFLIIAAALLITFAAGSNVRDNGREDIIIPPSCFACPSVKSFRFGIRPWQRYRPSDVSFTSQKDTFTCTYKTEVYVNEEHNKPSVIGRCSYYNDGTLKQNDFDTPESPSSLECPHRAPIDKACVHTAVAVNSSLEERQDPPPPPPPEVPVDEDEDEEDEEEGTDPEDPEEEGEELDDDDEDDDGPDEGEPDDNDILAKACEALLESFEQFIPTLNNNQEEIICALEREQVIHRIEQLMTGIEFTLESPADTLLAAISELYS